MVTLFNSGRLCVALLVLANALGLFAQHFIASPSNYHIGHKETVSFTSYQPKEVNVSVILSYRSCVCNNGGNNGRFSFISWPYRRCSKSSDNIHSRDSAIVGQGENVVFKLKMPDYASVLDNEYSLSVVNSETEEKYLEKTISFGSQASRGFLLVKTDKPIYKPSQTVRFCIIHVDKDLKPINSLSTPIQATIRDNKWRQVVKWNNISLASEGGFYCQEFTLSDEPSFGQWTVSVSLKTDRNCLYLPTPAGSCDFEVKEFVLPKFEVIVTGPDSVVSDDGFIRIGVLGKYVFGERLRGTVEVNATLTSPGRQDILVYNITDEALEFGAFSGNILIEKLFTETQYLYNPFCVKGSKLKVVAKVTEKGRGLSINETLNIPLKSKSISFEFAETVSKFFRPGLMYTVKAIGKNVEGGSPIKTRIEAIINNGKETVHDSLQLTKIESGQHVVISEFLVPSHANCLKINLYPVDNQFTCETESSVCLAPAPFHSPTRSFVQLSSESVSYTAGSEAVLNVVATMPFTTLHYIVVSRGGIVAHESIDTTVGSSEDGVNQTSFSLPITSNMSPKAKILAGFARTDGEIVMDLLEIDVDCELENDVSLSFNVSDTAEPGDGVSIAMHSDPNSVVLLSVSDSSLQLLADACKSTSVDSVCALLNSNDNGYFLRSVGTSCDNYYSTCSSKCSEATKYSVQSLIQSTGITIDTNMFVPEPPRRYYRPIINPFPMYEDFTPLLSTRTGGPAGPVNNFPTPPLSFPNELQMAEESQSVQNVGENEMRDVGENEGVDIRDFFPESWIWTILKANSSTGIANLNDIVPDTLTTWSAEAVALSAQKGLGISSKASLTVKKPLFVSLELPYSINWGETLKVSPLVFNLQRQRTESNISITVSAHEELSLLEPKHPSSISVKPMNSEAFDIFIKPRSVGRFDISITVVDSVSGLVDRVRKEIFVKPGCNKHSNSTTLITSDSGKHCFSYSLPSCVIPGSANAVITITGDIMSFPDLDHLLILPSGCGEQNLVKTAVNYVVGRYLSATGGLEDDEETKIKKNLQIGYQKQLNYLSPNGCFGIWRGGCTSWLTAAVVKYFSGMHSFYSAQGYDEELVEESEIQSFVQYLLQSQRKTGKFDLIGRSHNTRLVNDKGRNTHTAFTLVALKAYRQAFEVVDNTKLNDAISQTERHLIKRYSKNKFCTYCLAIAVHGLYMESSSLSSTDKQKADRMVEDLKGKIQTSEEYPDTCFACDMSRESCGSYFVRYERSSVCVETTGYALLAFLSAGDLDKTVCLANWLVRIRNGGGGYYSSQDTIIALEALAKFAETTFSKNINLNFGVALSGTASSSQHSISASNRHVVHRTQVVNIPSENNCVSWSGNGTGIVQSSLTFYGCNCDEDASMFRLELSTELKDGGRLSRFKALLLHINLEYLEEDESNMVIIDVELPSGYSVEGWLDSYQNIEKFELSGSSAVFYLNGLSNKRKTVLSVQMEQNVIVSNPQQSPVTVYDYYEPSNTITHYYKPETTANKQPLQPLLPIPPPVEPLRPPPGTIPPPSPQPPGVLPPSRPPPSTIPSSRPPTGIVSPGRE